ncbi:hypothetical protein [Roseibium aggregatum]|uniref:DUF2029 domain-containing protein n=1 Tax=Roseibium aggregatum TaxID=187304 RepID=A0A939EH70_9HYPH|nr:hypothetical protein [Roseibium aggregatum]MBN9673055.1 hypothetical protein [Roseibium aggregatum]
MSNLAQRSLEGTFLVLYRTACRAYRPLRGWIGAAVLCVFIAMTAAVVHFFPQSNWDMFAYTAAILEPEAESAKDLHQQAYSIVKDNVSDGEYLTLTRDRPYRIRQADDPDAFMTMLGFYRLKLLYFETARVLTAFMDPVKALRLISLASAVAVGGVLLVWLGRTGTLMYGPVVVALLTVSAFGDAAQLLSPDLYATVFLVLTAWFYLERWDIPAALSLIAAFLVRPDHLAFIGVFFVFAAIYGPGRWTLSACFAACLALYVWLTRGAHHPGWWIHLWFTHVEYVPTLEGFDPPFSVASYLKILMRSTVRSLMSQTWLAVLFAEVLFFARCIRPAGMNARAKVLLYAVFASICAKYVVFPHYETRFYLPYLVIMGMILLVSWHRQQVSGPDSRKVSAG